MDSSKTHARQWCLTRVEPPRHSQWWCHIINPLFWGRGQGSGRKECLIDDVLTNSPLILPSCSLSQKESLQAWGSGVRSEWRLQDKQDFLWVTSSSVTVQFYSYSYLEHAIRKGLRAPRWELDWSDRRSYKHQVEAVALPILPNSGYIKIDV